MTWHERLKERAGSNRKAARQLFPEWRKTARREVDREKTTELALANKIGTLHHKGDPTGWWRDRPVLRQLLADLLELEVDEIFGAPSHALAPRFREFPALPPLERDEAPCRTSRSGSVFDLTCAAVNDTDRRRHWIVVPPGGGKSLAIELLRVRFPGEVNAQTVVRLGEAVALARNDAARPIVLEVEEPDPANDLTSVGALEMHRASVVVLAPFMHPDDRIQEWRASLPKDTPRGWNGTWATSHAAPDPGWIVRMLEWVNDRLASSPRDSKFDKDDVREWLDAHPSVRRTVQSPGDLLALCADFDTYGSEGAPQERAERWLRFIGVKALPQDAPRSWSTYVAVDCVTAMMEAHALDRATVLQERSFKGWSAVVPPSAPSSENAPGPELVVGFLRAAGLLRADEHGVTVFPKWVAGALAQRRLVQLVKEGEVRTWGAIAGDASRQSLVDDALDALASSDLRAAGQPLLTGEATKAITFAEVAALEALVAAMGRRLVDGEPDPRDADLAKRALVRQLGFLVSGASIGERRVPTTRRTRDEEWFLSGWTISFATDGTDIEVPSDLRWVLPGWSPELQLSEAGRLNHIPWSSVQPWGVSEAVQALVQLTPKAVARLTPSDVPKDVPRLLLPALILAEGWEVTHEHLSQLETWEETVLADAVQRLDDERRRSLAALFWKFASKAVGASNAAPVAERIAYLQNHHAPLLRFVLENLPAAVVEDTARLAGTHRRQISGSSYAPSDPRALSHLSFEQRAAAVRGRLADEFRLDEVRELVEVLDGDDLEMLLDVVRAADRNVAWEFASRVWRVRPERAEVEARRAFDDGLAAAEAWFRAAPRARFGVLIEMVDAASEQPPWVRDWALAKLLDAGVHAESLFRLMRPASPTPTPPKAPVKKRAR